LPLGVTSRIWSKCGQVSIERLTPCKSSSRIVANPSLAPIRRIAWDALGMRAERPQQAAATNG
jgi:hypothetical protein